jgi:hypothetical protein
MDAIGDSLSLVFSSMFFFFSPAPPWLCSRHPWIAVSLTTGIPFACKTCGRRIASAAEMSAHLDWHFKMAKRATLIAKQSSGARSQNWYWAESEWVAADDVIFGVQERGKIASSSGTASGATASAAQAAKEEAAKRAAMAEPADQKQKRCAVSFGITFISSSVFFCCPVRTVLRRCG